MRVHRLRVIATCVSLAALCGCAGTASRTTSAAPTSTQHAAADPARYVAGGFQPDPARGVVMAIMPVPMTGDMAARIDLGFDRCFADTPGFQLRYPSAQMRTRMNGDHKLVLLLNQISKLETDSKPGTTAPGLDTFMATHELAHLREVLMTTDILLVPSAFEFGDKNKTTTGHFTARIYDLRTGRLLFRDVFRQTMPSGHNAQIAAAMEMILTANARIAADLLPKSH